MHTFSHYRGELSAPGPAGVFARKKTPPGVLAEEYACYAEDYIMAAGAISKDVRRLLLPFMQLSGHAIESAMKACVSSARAEVPKGAAGHNLVALGDSVLRLGFAVSEPHKICVVQIDHLYNSDLYGGARYKARYPPPSMEDIGGSVPIHNDLRELVVSLCSQARVRNHQEGVGGVQDGA